MTGAAGRAQGAGRGHLLAIGAVLLGGLALRVALAGYSLWFDELASLFYADHPLGTLWSPWILRETNPPLYYTLLRGWIAAFGTSLASVRSLSILGGMLGIGLLVAGSLRWYGPRAALAVAVLACLSPQHIYFSHQVRAYIFGFDSLLLSLIGLHMLGTEPARRGVGAALYAGGAVLAIYFHTTLFLWPAIATLAFAAIFRRELLADGMRPLLWLLAADLLILAGSSWWLAMTVRQLRDAHGNIDWIAPMTLGAYRSMLANTVMLLRAPTGAEKILPYLILLGAVAGAAATWAKSATRLFAAAAVLAVLMFGAAGLVRPIVLARTIFWFSIFTTLLLGAGIGAIRRDGVRYAALGLLAAVLVLNLVRGFPKFAAEPWSAAMDTVAHTPGAVLVVEGEPMAVAAEQACRVEFPATPCPVRTIALASASPYDSWAHGMSGQRMLPAAELGAGLPADARVYTISHAIYLPLLSVQAAGYLKGVPVETDVLAGPFSPAQLPGGRGH